MSGALSRNKGRKGEQEVAAIVREWLGLDVSRNWEGQAAVGGSDLTGIPVWSVEVKRSAVDKRDEWWRQTVRQATDAGLRPCLWFRIDGHGRGLEPWEKWQCVVFLRDIGVDVDGTAVVRAHSWMDYVRETLEQPDEDRSVQTSAMAVR